MQKRLGRQTFEVILMYENIYLAHHGILGQKWGVRRYQNRDGSLTRAGRKHRGLSLRPRKTDPVKAIRQASKIAQAKAKQEAQLAKVKAKEEAKLAKIRAKQEADVAKIRKDSKTEQDKALEAVTADEKFGKSTFKNLDKMSDQELSDAIKRLKMEDEYRKLMNATMPIDPKMAKQLSTKDKLQINGEALKVEGTKMVSTALKTAGQEKMTDLMRYAMTKGINYLVQDEAISSNNGSKKKFLAEQEWARNGYKRDYDPKNGTKNRYSDAYSDGSNRAPSTLYSLMTSGKLKANDLSSKELSSLVSYTKDLSNVKTYTDTYRGKKQNGGMTKSEAEDFIKDYLEKYNS